MSTRAPKMNPADFMIKRTGMSRMEITEKHLLGKNLLLKVSQGRVHTITPRIESVLWHEWTERGIDQDLFDAEYGTLSLDTAYQKWRDQQRARNNGKIPTGVKLDPRVSPFRSIVNAVGGVSRMAKILLVADSPVEEYAKGRQIVMPLSVREALSDVKYPNIEKLDIAQKAWRKRVYGE